MKNIKSFNQFINEENLFRDAAIGAGILTAGLGGMTDATGQVINRQDDETEIVGKFGVDAMEDERGTEVTNKTIIGYMDDLVMSVPEVAHKNGIELTKSHTLVGAQDLGGFDFYRLIVQVDGSSDTHEIYISKKEYEDFLETNRLSTYVLSQFKDLEKIPYRMNRPERNTTKEFRYRL
jgi:hypothetical protein